jgi:hypothetical protein
MHKSPTTLDIVTLVIAIGALVISAVALTWQIVQHYLLGARVSVELLWGRLDQGAVVVGPIKDGSLETIQRQGFQNPVFAIRGRNWGRLAVDITGYWVSIDSGVAVSATDLQINEDLPHRLRAGSRVTFYCPMGQLISTALTTSSEVERQSQCKLRGTLELGTGKTVHGDWQTIIGLPRL